MSVDHFGVESQEVFYRCAEASNEAIMITDKEGLIRYVNKAFEVIYQYKASAVIGQTPRLLRSGAHDARFYAHMWNDILDPSKRMWRGEIVNRAMDGSEVPVLLSISPYQKDGQTLGYMSIALDMREQKKMEAQILHQDRLASIGLLASGLAHEIGTPLGVIRGRAEYMMMRAQIEDKKGLETIVNQIDRISKLIYALLHVARSGKSETNVLVKAEPVCHEVAVLVGQLIKKNSITLEVFLESVTILGDCDRFEQLLLNLMMNSIHAIEASRNQEKKGPFKITVSSKRQGKFWEISIKDNGCGISRANLKKIFKPFFTTKEVGTGTGLGLVACQNIVGAWGGSMDVKSREGEGTEFVLTIPSANP